MSALQIVSALAISGLLVGIVLLNLWYRGSRKHKPAPTANDLNVW